MNELVDKKTCGTCEEYFRSFVDLGDVWSRPDVYDEGPQEASRAAMQNKTPRLHNSFKKTREVYFRSFVDLGDGLWSRPDVYDEGTHAASRTVDGAYGHGLDWKRAVGSSD